MPRSAQVAAASSRMIPRVLRLFEQRGVDVTALARRLRLPPGALQAEEVALAPCDFEALIQAGVQQLSDPLLGLHLPELLEWPRSRRGWRKASNFDPLCVVGNETRRVDRAAAGSSSVWSDAQPWPILVQLPAPEQVTTMRFMLLMIQDVAEKNWTPDARAAAAMGKYNAALQKAGALLALDGLHPPSKGSRVSFSGGKSHVTEGPFREAREVVGGYWLIQVKSKAEAVEWARRCPAPEGHAIEVRQVCELADFPPEVQRAVTSG